MSSESTHRFMPGFFGFRLGVDEQYELAADNRLFRLGVKVNTPNKCNWACPYCYAHISEAEQHRDRIPGKTVAPRWDKDPEWVSRMKSWIAQGIALGIKAVTINGTFEPTMSPDYGEIIHYCRGEGLQVTLATNGSLLTRSSMRLLLDWDVAVLTKMNTPLVDEIDPRYEDLCRIQKGLFGAKGAARRVYEDQKRLIGALIDFGFNSHPQAGYSRLGVESVITTLNLPYLPELVAWLRVRNIYAHIEVAKMQGMGKRNGHIYPARQEVRKLFETIRQQDVSMGFPDWHPKPPCVATTCYENLYRVDIHADGKVRPCPSIEIDLGDLNRQSLAEVIRNEKLQVIRNLEKHIQGDCKNCELFRSRQCYGGCRGMVYQWAKSMGLTEYEALSASDPSCWRVEKALDNGLRAEACREAI